MAVRLAAALLAAAAGCVSTEAPVSQEPQGRWSGPEAQAAYMRRCVELAREAKAQGAGPYGALIVDPEVGIVAEGRNHAAKNPIWHGEMAAIANFSDLIAPRAVYDAAPRLELYTSAEPCPMCMSAIAWSGFGRVVYGTSIPFIAKHGGSQIMVRAAELAAKSPKHVAVLGGLLANETDPLYVQGAAHQHLGDELQDEADASWFRGRFGADLGREASPSRLLFS